MLLGRYVQGDILDMTWARYSALRNALPEANRIASGRPLTLEEVTRRRLADKKRKKKG